MDDFDYSSPIQSLLYEDPDGNRGSPLSKGDLKMAEELKKEVKERAFLAVSLLDMFGYEEDEDGIERVEKEAIDRQVCHDLESFYWLLIWVVLRHTKHSHKQKARAFNILFDVNTEATAQTMKIVFVARKSLSVEGNRPLSWLLDKLRRLVLAANSDIIESGGIAQGSLTYESMLSVFNEALAMDCWPADDKAIPFPPPTLRQNKPSDGTLTLGNGHKQKGSVRASGQPELGKIPELPTHNGAYDGTNKGPDVPCPRSQAPIAGSSGAAARPSASGVASTRCRKRNWREILPARGQHERRAKRARQN
ncbi:hypothetical protein WOLCODRAFT_158461 [Wolfiporia cocos MD-104 SS10]|uniref:Fungal-type protein kinase domain-containing protein n=1 Tax=Wolfiporia cocos (strain MD-104) TaxID=742152 RepID=A0A2H3JBG2_WOLCO|nr:hypothetical protein WOLCODRAFT_158461 [Wolfiporia cocos MD-104 SS10]